MIEGFREFLEGLNSSTSSVLWTVFPVIFSLKTIYIFFNESSMLSFLQVLKGALKALFCLWLLNAVFSDLTDVLVPYLDIARVEIKTESTISFLKSGFNYVLSLFAFTANGVLFLIVGFMLIFLSVILVPSYAAHSVLGYSDVWGISKKQILAVMAWFFVVYFLKDLGPLTDEGKSEIGTLYFLKVILSSVLSFVFIGIAFKTRVLPIAKQSALKTKMGEKFAENYKAKMKRKLNDGKVIFSPVDNSFMPRRRNLRREAAFEWKKEKREQREQEKQFKKEQERERKRQEKGRSKNPGHDLGYGFSGTRHERNEWSTESPRRRKANRNSRRPYNLKNSAGQFQKRNQKPDYSYDSVHQTSVELKYRPNKHTISQDSYTKKNTSNYEQKTKVFDANLNQKTAPKPNKNQAVNKIKKEDPKTRLKRRVEHEL